MACASAGAEHPVPVGTIDLDYFGAALPFLPGPLSKLRPAHVRLLSMRFIPPVLFPHGKVRAVLPLALLFPLALFGQEVCTNGIDDDGDGLIDLNDPDCPCSTLLAADDLPSYIRNHSFEDRSCCPFGFVTPVSPPWLDCADGWHQATAATSDYFNMCGYAPAGMPLPPPDGDGAVGFQMVQNMGYMEYVGTCLTYPAPSNPLLAGTTYTLSLWIVGAVSNSQLTQTEEEGSANALFPDPMPLALFGHAYSCVPFPIPTDGCLGHEPGWEELGRVLVQSAWDWTRVSITFTPTADIHSVVIGSACDLPVSFNSQTVMDAQGVWQTYYAYFMVDDLMLTVAQDQVLSPTTTSGNLCSGNAVASAQPPVGSSDHHWYLNGVALVGQTGTSLDISSAGLADGMYTLTSNVNGECLMGSAFLPAPLAPTPFPALLPTSGCAPLTVAFADTTGGGSTTLAWDLGDGTVLSDPQFAHTYTAPGVYDVRLRVRNTAGCIGDTLLVGAVVVHPLMNGQIGIDPEPADADHPEVQLSSTGSTNIVSWWWDLGVADPATSTDPAVTALFPTVPGHYPVMLVVTSADGCVDTVRSVVTVVRPGVIAMPNVFSPNGDGVNEQFLPLDHDGTPGVMEVYNRWGQLVFHTRALASGWPGTDVPDGTYFFIITPDDPTAERISGHVTLVR